MEEDEISPYEKSATTLDECVHIWLEGDMVVVGEAPKEEATHHEGVYEE